mmetsp:Transcript_7661/g.13962  ORF Transcript_7661/g.13962 Transcript_7661/m.13962 type:complete len:200 (-) Transcript_7661:259-858(-)
MNSGPFCRTNLCLTSDQISLPREAIMYATMPMIVRKRTATFSSRMQMKVEDRPPASIADAAGLDDAFCMAMASSTFCSGGRVMPSLASRVASRSLAGTALSIAAAPLFTSGRLTFVPPVAGSTKEALCVFALLMTCCVVSTVSRHFPSKPSMCPWRQDKIPVSSRLHHLSMSWLQRKGTECPTSFLQSSEMTSWLYPKQ